MVVEEVEVDWVVVVEVVKEENIQPVLPETLVELFPASQVAPPVAVESLMDI